jgi:hypothetical protein
MEAEDDDVVPGPAARRAQPGVVSGVGQRVAATVPKYVRVDEKGHAGALAQAGKRRCRSSWASSGHRAQKRRRVALALARVAGDVERVFRRLALDTKAVFAFSGA